MAHHDDRQPFLDRLLERGGDCLRHRSKRIVEHEEVRPAKTHGRRGNAFPFVLEFRNGRLLVGLDLLLVGVKPVLVVAHAGDNAVGTDAACAVLDVRRTHEVHEVTCVDDLDSPYSGMVDRLPEIVFAKLPALARTRLREGVCRLSVAAVNAGDVRIGDMQNRKRLVDAKANGYLSHLEGRYRVVGEPSQRC